MKKFNVFAITLITLLAFGLAFSSCGDGGETPLGSVSYVYTKNGTTYSLTITENAARAAYAPANGDTYLLLIISNGGTNTSKGIVAFVKGGVLTLKPENSSTVFTAKVSGGSITSIEGTITLTGSDGTVQGPDTPGINNGGDSALNGTWVRKKKKKMVFDNGYVTLSSSGVETHKGNYTISGTNMTLIFTQSWVKTPSGSGWYTREEAEALLRSVGILSETQIQAQLKNTYGPLTGTYTISSNTLTLTVEGETNVLTRQS
jgi:hypothetical protein